MDALRQARGGRETGKLGDARKPPGLRETDQLDPQSPETMLKRFTVDDGETLHGRGPAYAPIG